MPYLKVETNQSLDDDQKAILLREASTLIARELNKPESMIMIALHPGVAMAFGGTDGPVAYLELKSIGLPGEKTKALSKVLCTLVETHLRIPPERIYIKFMDIQRSMWGWRGDTFA